MTPLFLNNLLPILLTAGIGYMLGQWLEIDPHSVSRILFYALSPFLIFDLLANSQINQGAMLRIMAFSTTQVFVLTVATWLLGRALQIERKLLAAVIITAVFMNAANFGLSLNFFAFGEAAMTHAGIYYVMTAILTYSLGVAIASLGSLNLKQSLLKLVKIPTIYAAILGILFNLLDWHLPTPLERTSSLLSGATIPVMLILLGLQLQRNQRSWNWRALGLATGMRLFGGAGLALATAGLFGLKGMAYNAAILESAMPTAVVTTVLATEFDAKPTFVTTVVFITTLLSPLTLTPILAYLGV